MNTTEKEQLYATIKKGVLSAFEQEKEGGLCDFEIEISVYNDWVTVTVSQMYEFLPLTFKTLTALAETFGTMEFKVNNWSSGGCETCDYGSKYAHEFSYQLKTDK